MKKDKLNIMDWYCHQGHQYEFFKTGHNFYLSGLNGKIPDWNSKHRPKNENLRFIREAAAKNMKFDVVIIRSPLNIRRYAPFIKRGASAVAVVQTTNPYPVPNKVRHIVWNSYRAMEQCKRFYKNKVHHYIVHGYDPNEFCKLDIDDNGRVLTVANAFKRRAEIMGFPLWEEIDENIGNICDILGHANEDIDKDIREAKDLKELIKAYNSYSIYFNPTIESAMPRSRAEAAMCGMPIVTTNNFDVGQYFSHKKNAIVSNDKKVIEENILKLLESKDMREEYGNLAREVAIKNFHIKDYLEKWNDVFRRL